jgi:dipeptidyl aminopeptidase/acylaminoacyl peptidase
MHLKLLPLAVALLCALPAFAAEDAAPKEGTLTSFLKSDSTDTQTLLLAIQQTQFAQRADNTHLLFMQLYGNRVRMERTYYPANTPDHEMVPCCLFTPADLKPGTRRPGLVIVHGGLHENLDWRFFRLVVEAVEHGYAVIFPEYHGSMGYGDAIYNNTYGVTDVADVFAAADYLATKDYVDASRMGILGHSRGGMVTLLCLEKQPKRFQAAVEICALCDFIGYMAYKPETRRAEIAREAHFAGKLPDKNLPAYLDISPINFVEKIETPLLAIATSGDKIVPLALNTGRLVQILKANNKTFDAKIYDNAPGGHVYLFGDSPETADTFKRSWDWLGRYLKP